MQYTHFLYVLLNGENGTGSEKAKNEMKKVVKIIKNYKIYSNTLPDTQLEVRNQGLSVHFYSLGLFMQSISMVKSFTSKAAWGSPKLKFQSFQRYFRKNFHCENHMNDKHINFRKYKFQIICIVFVIKITWLHIYTYSLCSVELIMIFTFGFPEKKTETFVVFFCYQKVPISQIVI